jgi:hypothetical protein
MPLTIFFNVPFCYFIDNRTNNFSDGVGLNPRWPKLLIYSFVKFEDERANLIFVDLWHIWNWSNDKYW